MKEKFDLVFFGLAEVAERYDFSRVYALNLVNQKRLKAHRMLRGFYVAREDLVTFEREYIKTMRGRIADLEHRISWLAKHPIPPVDKALRQRVAAAYKPRKRRGAKKTIA